MKESAQYVLIGVILAIVAIGLLWLAFWIDSLIPVGHWSIAPLVLTVVIIEATLWAMVAAAFQCGKEEAEKESN